MERRPRREILDTVLSPPHFPESKDCLPDLKALVGRVSACRLDRNSLSVVIRPAIGAAERTHFLTNKAAGPELQVIVKLPGGSEQTKTGPGKRKWPLGGGEMARLCGERKKGAGPGWPRPLNEASVTYNLTV